jgi:hypothetical protein
MQIPRSQFLQLAGAVAAAPAVSQLATFATAMEELASTPDARERNRYESL